MAIRDRLSIYTPPGVCRVTARTAFIGTPNASSRRSTTAGCDARDSVAFSPRLSLSPRAEAEIASYGRPMRATGAPFPFPEIQNAFRRPFLAHVPFPIARLKAANEFDRGGSRHSCAIYLLPATNRVMLEGKTSLSDLIRSLFLEARVLARMGTFAAQSIASITPLRSLTYRWREQSCFCTCQRFFRVKERLRHFERLVRTPNDVHGTKDWFARIDCEEVTPRPEAHLRQRASIPPNPVPAGLNWAIRHAIGVCFTPARVVRTFPVRSPLTAPAVEGASQRLAAANLVAMPEDSAAC
jgi:hypothetical protein